MKHLPVILLVVALALSGCGNNHRGAIEASGTLEAVEVRVSAKVAGQVQQLLADEGAQVKPGDTLAILDHETLSLQLAQADAGVDLARAQLDLLLNGARSEDLAQATDAVKQLESSLKNATDDYERMKQLFAVSSVSRKQYDDAESRFTITSAQFSAAKQNLQKLERFARPEDLEAAKARVGQAKAAADLLRKQVRDSFVIAPVAGTVTNRPVEVGELLSAGTAVVTIARLETMDLRIYVSETELGRVKLNGEADVVIDAYPDRNFPGRIVFISPTAEFTPKNVQTKEDRTKLVFGVKLEVPNAEGILKAGMPADAYVK
jgi:HlyD family secretion protein